MLNRLFHYQLSLYSLELVESNRLIFLLAYISGHFLHSFCFVLFPEGLD